MATIREIHALLAQGETVSLQGRYVATVLEGLAAQVQGIEQYRIQPGASGLTDIQLERACRICHSRYTGPACTVCAVPA